MSVRGIAGMESFHLDGTKATARQLVIDGITANVFRGSIDSDHVQQLAAFILHVSIPPSPYRALTDQLSSLAREGAVIVRREVWLDAQYQLVGGVVQFDPDFQALLHEWGDPDIVSREGCALSRCHTAPWWTTPNPDRIQSRL
ncbi:MAG: hypothetical protein D6690_11725 [Nitrospirae bacterium]|nr:MAG: hypothetical protein D6690_11725 [Nitrospirota bacterium]